MPYCDFRNTYNKVPPWVPIVLVLAGIISCYAIVHNASEDTRVTSQNVLLHEFSVGFDSGVVACVEDSYKQGFYEELFITYPMELLLDTSVCDTTVVKRMFGVIDTIVFIQVDLYYEGDSIP